MMITVTVFGVSYEGNVDHTALQPFAMFLTTRDMEFLTNFRANSSIIIIVITITKDITLSSCT